jgi:hypothetical protein
MLFGRSYGVQLRDDVFDRVGDVIVSQLAPYLTVNNQQSINQSNKTPRVRNN